MRRSPVILSFFFFNDTATTEIYTLSLHDALPISASAAQEDPRFAPMRAEQLDELSIEISLLSPMEPIVPEAIEIGRHGLFIRLHAQRGLLLPQVAIEHRLTTEQFLERNGRKAGLPR